MNPWQIGVGSWMIFLACTAKSNASSPKEKFIMTVIYWLWTFTGFLLISLGLKP